MISRLLLVADETAWLQAHAFALAPFFDVAVATSGSQALERIEREDALAAIVCTAELADIEGLEVLARARLCRPSVRRLLTCRSGHESSVQGSAALLERAVNHGGAQRVLLHPFEPRELVQAVRELVREQHTEAVTGTLYGLVGELAAAADLGAIAAHAARAAHQLLAGRGVRVRLRDAPAPRGYVETVLGTEPRWRHHRVPLSDCGDDVGRIDVDLTNREKLSAGELEHLDSVARPTAASAGREARHMSHDLAQQSILLAMARLAERRDDETGKHIERVSRYCRLLAAGLREDGLHTEIITDGFIDGLYRAAPLHDIGKIGIPDAVLLKPGKLDEHEWALMKTHSELGGRAIDDVVSTLERPGYLVLGSEIAWCHHERWNGSGYPRGLVGDEIPLSARILTVVDVYDALTSERPYKRAWTHEAAVDHIRVVSGAHLDPEVVTSFLRRLDQVDAIRTMYADTAEAHRAPLTQLLDVA